MQCVILADSPGALIELCGISVLERLLRTLQRCGITRAIVLTSTTKEISDALARPSRPREGLEIQVRNRPPGEIAVNEIVDFWPNAAQFLFVVRGDTVFDMRLLRLLLGQNESAALIDDSELCGAALLQHEWALEQSALLDDSIRKGMERSAVAAVAVADQPIYSPALRRDLRPFWFRAPAADQQKMAERVLISATQKGSQDLPALVHAPIEKFLVSRLCKTSITPHQLTICWIIFAFITTFLFAEGHVVWGIVLALGIGILDGIDGKLARLKVETSSAGKFEHWFDSFFEFAWPTALAYHFYTSGQLPGAFRYLLVFMLAEMLDAIGKHGVYSAYAKLMIEPGLFDKAVRLVGGRRNIYVWILIVAVICGAPEKMIVIMAWWEMTTAAVDLSHAAWLAHKSPSQNLKVS